MRLRDDLRQCVGFIGVGSSKDDFVPAGTVFFVGYKETRYLVTARHVAEDLEDLPFAVRVNKKDGKGLIDARYDPIEHAKDFPWLLHPDELVDLALMEFNVDWTEFDGDVMCIPQELFATQEKAFDDWNVGVGDVVNSVGLFPLMRGQNRNLPFVHSGHIGMLPGDERIPVKNWRQGKGAPDTVHVEGYLVEMLSLEGLSGSPVFVRPTFDFIELPLNDGAKGAARLLTRDPLLLGVWQGAWGGYPDKHLQRLTNDRQLKVPVGIGIVVPIQKVVEILESASVVERRNAFLARVSAAREERSRAEPD